IDAREIEAEPSIETLQAWLAYLKGTAGGLAVAAGRVLGTPGAEELRPLGMAYGVAGLLRSVSAHARQGRCLLPEDVLAEHGLTIQHVIADPAAPAVATIMRRLADQGLGLLVPPRVTRQTVAAALPAVLARRDLKRAQIFPSQRG